MESSSMSSDSSDSESQDSFYVVVSPVPVLVKKVNSVEEALEVIKHHASVMQVPENLIGCNGLFSVFEGVERCLRTSRSEINLDS